MDYTKGLDDEWARSNADYSVKRRQGHLQESSDGQDLQKAPWIRLGLALGYLVLEFYRSVFRVSILHWKTSDFGSGVICGLQFSIF